MTRCITAAALIVCTLGAAAAQQPGEVVASWPLDNGTPGFTTDIPAWSLFGSSVAAMGDVDGDGQQDLLIGGEEFTTPEPLLRGNAWIVRRDGAGGVLQMDSFGSHPELAAAFDQTQHLGDAVARLGDLDGDGVDDIALGAGWTAVGGPYRGAVYVVLRDAAGGIKSVHAITSLSGDLPAPLDDSDHFGQGLAALGDVDGDGVPDLAVGAPGDDDGAVTSPNTSNGAVWLLHLAPDGSVHSSSKISATQGGFTGDITKASFGRGLTALGDLDGNGVNDLAVGATSTSSYKGAVWILRLDATGSVIGQQKIGQGSGGFSGTLATPAQFGEGLAGMGDLDGDGLQELAVGAPGGPAATATGRVFLLRLNSDGTVASQVEVNAATGFAGPLQPHDFFGCSLARMPDVDGNGVADLAVGALFDSSSNQTPDWRGAAWVLRLDASLHVIGSERIGRGTPGISIGIDDLNHFGSAVARLGDLDGDGQPEFAVGAPEPLSTGGTVHLLSIAADHTVVAHSRLDQTHGGLAASAGLPYTAFGASVASLGDVNGDGTPDLAIGAPEQGYDGIAPNGYVFIVLLKPDGTALSTKLIQNLGGGPSTYPFHDFGTSLAGLGDIDGDGVGDLAVGGTKFVWILRLKPDGSLKASTRIGAGQSGFTGPTPDGFGSSVALIGDIDRDGLPDIAVGSADPNFGQVGSSFLGGVWLLSLNATGQVHGEVHIAQGVGGLGAVLAPGAHFGASVAPAGDLDGDGLPDLLVGAPGDGTVGPTTGTVHVLLLAADGTVKSHSTIDAGLDLATGDTFGSALASLGDLDGDGQAEWAVGLPLDDGADIEAWGNDSGALRLLTLHQDAQHWALTGPALSGSAGKPMLSGSGVLDGVTPAALDLAHARPSAGVVLVFGLTPLNAPFKGGTMVPTPMILVTGLATDPAGKLHLPLPWPTGLPSGFEAWFQDWISDPAGPKGWAASNGLVGYVP